MPSTAFSAGTVAAKPFRDSGVFQTSPGMLRRRLLAPWTEGIQQYLAIRLGDATRGRAAFRTLMRMVDSLPAEELLEAPGAKAQLYRLARSVAQTEQAMPGGARGESLVWRESSGRDFAQLRALLAPRDAEILELRHARELGLREIAFVLELSDDEAELRLDTASAHARQILGAAAPDPLQTHASIYVEAFALARSWNEDDLDIAVEDEDGLDAGTLVGGRYQLVERVGVGAFGDVYRAEDIEVHGHQVALKVLRQPALSESARQSALRELKLNAAAFHPSLVQFKDHGWFEQRLWFVMPWYEGETLEARMRREPLSRDEAREIFVPLARALAALHTAGIRHQDIKPENILLTRLPGEGLLPVLIDLGVAAHEQETMLGGTPLYFAPEVAARFADEGGTTAIGPSADVFALALTLRNALEPHTQPDVPGGAVRSFVARRATEMPSLPVGRDLRFLAGRFERWMSLDPEDRPTAMEFAEQLSVLTMPEERRARRVRLVRWLAPLLLILAAVFGAVVYLMQQRVERGQHATRTARAAAAEARADLMVADARQQALEEGNSALLARYQQSRLSRGELAGELATIQGQLRIVRRQLASTLEGRRRAQELLAATRTTLASRQQTLEETEAARDSARAQLSEVRGQLTAARRDALAAQAERDAARRRVAATAERLERAIARADTVEVELAEASRARDGARAELANLRARVAGLVSAIAERPATGPSEVAAPSENNHEPSAPQVEGQADDIAGSPPLEAPVDPAS